MLKKIKNKLKKIRLMALDFDGTLTIGAYVIFNQDGLESVICSRRDSLGINMLMDAGVDVVVISKESNLVVENRCKKMGVKCWSGVATGKNKLEILQKYAVEYGLGPEEICYGGDDVNDVASLEWSGFSFTVADGHKQCKKKVDYVTKCNGGDGAVREVCDLILQTRNTDITH